MAIQKTKEPSKVDAALQRFAEMLIKRMEEMQKDWHKGWIGGPNHLIGKNRQHFGHALTAPLFFCP